jgi:hypothetical protein
MNLNKQYVNQYVNDLLNSQKNQSMKNIIYDLQTFICLAGKASSLALSKVFNLVEGYLKSTVLDIDIEKQKDIRMKYFSTYQKLNLLFASDIITIGMCQNWKSIEEKEIGMRVLRCVEKYGYTFTSQEVEEILKFYSFIVKYLDSQKPSDLQCLLCGTTTTRENDDIIRGGDINFICMKCRKTCQKCRKNKADIFLTFNIKPEAEKSYPKPVGIPRKHTVCNKCLKYYIYKSGTYYDDYVDSTHNSCTNITKLCGICDNKFQPEETYYNCEFKNRRFGCYISKETGEYVCDKCNKNIGKAPICKKCGEYFESRNELFLHLKQFEDHQI